MSYYLEHFFVPDWKYQQLSPVATGEDSNNADMYNLGYVQNVISGQVLARIIPLDQAVNPDSQYILKEPVFPAGENTRIASEDPMYLLADANGYVFYHENKITVKNVLNVRSDVGFNTGNIFFVGDLAVHGDVKPGFEVAADNIRIKGMLEGGVARARRNLIVDGGCRCGAGGGCRIMAGGTVRAAFTEKIALRGRGTILIDKYCFYTDVYAGGNLVVVGRLNGGRINAYGCVYVGEQIGNAAGKPTQIYLGYNPQLIHILERDETKISELSSTITHLQAVAGHLPPDTNETTRKLADFLTRRRHLIQHRDTIWNKLYLDEQHVDQCRLIAQGDVLPGVEIYIGKAYYLVEKPCRGVAFFSRENEIVMEPLPAKS